MKLYLLLFCFSLFFPWNYIKAKNEQNLSDTLTVMCKINKIKEFENINIIYAQAKDSSIYKIISVNDNS
jgi:hypothetical protein